MALQKLKSLFNNNYVLQYTLIMQLIVKMNIFMSRRRASFKIIYELCFSFIRNRYVEQRLFYAHDQLTHVVYTPIFRTFTCYRSDSHAETGAFLFLQYSAIFDTRVKLKRREKEKRIFKSIAMKIWKTDQDINSS